MKRLNMKHAESGQFTGPVKMFCNEAGHLLQPYEGQIMQPQRLASAISSSWQIDILVVHGLPRKLYTQEAIGLVP